MVGSLHALGVCAGDQAGVRAPQGSDLLSLLRRPPGPPYARLAQRSRLRSGVSLRADASARVKKTAALAKMREQQFVDDAEMADIRLLCQLPNVDREEIRASFERVGLAELYDAHSVGTRRSSSANQLRTMRSSEGSESSGLGLITRNRPSGENLWMRSFRQSAT